MHIPARAASAAEIAEGTAAESPDHLNFTVCMSSACTLACVHTTHLCGQSAGITPQPLLATQSMEVRRHLDL